MLDAESGGIIFNIIQIDNLERCTMVIRASALLNYSDDKARLTDRNHALPVVRLEKLKDFILPWMTEATIPMC